MHAQYLSKCIYAIARAHSNARELQHLLLPMASFVTDKGVIPETSCFFLL